MKKVLNTIADVEEAMNELQGVEAQIAEEESGANGDIAKIRQGFIVSTGALQESAKRIRNKLESFAEDNKENDEIFPKGRKTLDLNSGTISIKLGSPSVSLAAGVKGEDVLVRISENGFAKKLLKAKDPELDKAAVKRLYDEEVIDDKMLKRLGLKIEQKESITVTLNTVDSYA